MGSESRSDTDLRHLMQAYKINCETEGLISDAIILTGEPSGLRLLEARAAVLGYSRSKLYLEAARNLMSQIEEDVSEISWRMQAVESITAEFDAPHSGASVEVLERDVHQMAIFAATSRVKAGALKLFDEVLWHFYAGSLQHTWYFIINAMRHVDPKFSPKPDDKRYMEIVQLFRNHMEHRDHASKDLESEHWKSMSASDLHGEILGYRLTKEGNVLFTPGRIPKGFPQHYEGVTQEMPMNASGFHTFESIAQSLMSETKELSLKRLQTWFAAHPERAPSPDLVGSTYRDEMTLAED